jgi:hypothetical protein
MVSMTYDEAQTARVTKSEAIREMTKNYWDGDAAADLVEYLGDHRTYRAKDVLSLMGW